MLGVNQSNRAVNAYGNQLLLPYTLLPSYIAENVDSWLFDEGYKFENYLDILKKLDKHRRRFP
ncbi:hypothetical protein HB904_17865 [Listeria booriae]|uniref:Uncharacterized protein n=2 Tax=Listeria booriae TaxID=1552123 RepID=A0A842AKR9_9LIST|nr:hypothetical protein [Listeria booriae]MBC1618047.1 hypothetical protein [Listeria booriae]